MEPSTPATPKDAATVVIVRPGREGVELFCVRRSGRSGFMAGAIVFPGGKVDAADQEATWSELATPPAERALAFRPDEPPDRALAFAVAGLRETLEEAAIVPVVGGRLDDAQARALRDEIAREKTARALLGWLRRRGLRLDVARLEALSRWITPTAEPKRYDTRFFVLPAPEGQRGAHDAYETTHSFWATPRQILARWEAGEIFLAPPTSCTIELFLDCETPEQALEVARCHPLDPVCPAFVRSGDETILTLPGDPLHPEPAAPRGAGAATRFVLRGGRFVGTSAGAPTPQTPSR